MNIVSHGKIIFFILWSSVKKVNPELYKTEVLDGGLLELIEKSQTENPTELREALQGSNFKQAKSKLAEIVSTYEQKRSAKNDEPNAKWNSVNLSKRNTSWMDGSFDSWIVFDLIIRIKIKIALNKQFIMTA